MATFTSGRSDGRADGRTDGFKFVFNPIVVKHILSYPTPSHPIPVDEPTDFSRQARDRFDGQMSHVCLNDL